MIKILKNFSYLFFFLLATGCSANVDTFHSSKSLGEQLSDLERAYQAHVITENEYKKAKEILIEHYK